MVINYYKSDNLKYASRERRHLIPLTPFSSETRKNIALNDGATTEITTSVDNLCDYVTIDGTRWFVVHYIYLNSKQVIMALQRDVIGEFGLNQMFGQIERGYTDTFLKNRKELSLNEILKKRTNLIPEVNKYGNFSTSTHNNEMWGFLYLVKPSGINPETGEKYPDKVNINIPSFAPQVVNYPNISANTEFQDGTVNGGMLHRFFLNVFVRAQTPSGAQWNGTSTFEITVYSVMPTQYGATLNFSRPSMTFTEVERKEDSEVTSKVNVRCGYFAGGGYLEIARTIMQRTQEIFNAESTMQDLADMFWYPPEPLNIPYLSIDYSDVVVKDGNDFYKYTVKDRYQKTSYGNMIEDKYLVHDRVADYFMSAVDRGIFPEGDVRGKIYFDDGQKYFFQTGEFVSNGSNEVHYDVITYNRTKLNATESGQIVIDLTKQLVDEPYYLLAVPLFDTKITGDDGSIFNIEKLSAFEVFNTVIQYLSGSNGYLIDAQIYPYCPDLMTVASSLVNIPFFDIRKNTFNHSVRFAPMASPDIKKEYITRKYKIISPDQSSQFSFNFYDYTTRITELNGINTAELLFTIKTALKPFGIIASCIVNPDSDSLIGHTYPSDMRGAQPSANGFQCSLSSNAFETYKRENSNYQQIFALDKQELQKSHEVERINEITSGVVNTVTATAMGAVAGASMGDTGIWNSFGSKAAGAMLGGSIAGTTVAAANVIQHQTNEALRSYERDLQQQRFDLQIGTIKALPNSINRVSSFNEILLQDFWFIVETYECSDKEKELVDTFIEMYGYGLGVHGFLNNFTKTGWFLRATINSSLLPTNLHNIAANDLRGGIYYYE